MSLCDQLKRKVVTKEAWRGKHAGHEIVEFSDYHSDVGVQVDGLQCVTCNKKLACKAKMA